MNDTRDMAVGSPVLLYHLKKHVGATGTCLIILDHCYFMVFHTISI